MSLQHHQRKYYFATRRIRLCQTQPVSSADWQAVNEQPINALTDFVMLSSIKDFKDVGDGPAKTMEHDNTSDFGKMFK